MLLLAAPGLRTGNRREGSGAPALPSVSTGVWTRSSCSGCLLLHNNLSVSIGRGKWLKTTIIYFVHESAVWTGLCRDSFFPFPCSISWWQQLGAGTVMQRLTHPSSSWCWLKAGTSAGAAGWDTCLWPLWASLASLHSGWVPRASVPRGQGRSPWHFYDLPLEVV